MKMQNLTLILSTGRTGTQFFETYLSESGKNILCLHEPKPSRKFKFYSNKLLAGKHIENKINNNYFDSRPKYLEGYADDVKYIESNNFLFGCVPALNLKQKNIKIVHIVRDPLTYVRSHINHGFWKGHKRWFAKNTNWLENIETRRSNDPVLILLDRWQYVNRIISEYEKTNPYLLIKFEDLFLSNENNGLKSLNKICDFIGIDCLSAETNIHWLSRPKNQSKNNNWDGNYQFSQKHIEWLTNEADDILNKWNYKLH